MRKLMTKRNFMFNHYIKGICCIAIICILPLISPAIFFFKNQNGFLPYIMILIAILGVYYEFIPIGIEEKLCKRLKWEKLLTIIWISIFGLYDLIVLICRCENPIDYSLVDYSLLGFVLAPVIVIGIELFLCIKEYISDNDDKNDSKKIAQGKAKKV